MLGEGAGHGAEHRRDGGQVVHAVAGGAQIGVGVGEHLLELVEGGLLGVFPRHVAEP